MKLSFFCVFGSDSGGATPVPIPNTEVKPSSADGTAWVTVRESRTLPEFFQALLRWFEEGLFLSPAGEIGEVFSRHAPEYRKRLVELMRLRYGQRKIDMVVALYAEVERG